jgi:hypothetical protein
VLGDTFCSLSYPGRLPQPLHLTRLYRPQDTFEAYCKDRWGMARNYANKLISGAQVVGNLGTNVPKPATEGVARPLTALTPEKQVEVWNAAVDTAHGRKAIQALVRIKILGGDHLPGQEAVRIRQNDAQDRLGREISRRHPGWGTLPSQGYRVYRVTSSPGNSTWGASSFAP